MFTLCTLHQVQYSDCLHLVFKPINNNVLVLIHLYCNELILIYYNNLNIAGILSLHKLTLSTVKKLNIKKIEEFYTNVLSSLYLTHTFSHTDHAACAQTFFLVLRLTF